MTRPTAVIVGAGLGGSILASRLLQTHDVTVIERGAATIDPRFPLVDVGKPARLLPHFGSGLGGSTQLWHNGLIEIDDELFDERWPIAKSALEPFYDEAFAQLSGVQRAVVRDAIATLRQKYRQLGLPGEHLPGLYYPRWPMNVWENCKLDGRVGVIRGDVVDFKLTDGGVIAELTVNMDGQCQQVAADVFILSAGGLGTPVLLQKLARRAALPALAHAGLHYEDHPMGFVGEVELTTPLYQLWNFRVPGTDGNLRLPLVVTRNGLRVSFQLRPAATYYRASRRERVGSVLNDLRRNPWNPLGYFKLLSHWDDVLDILSFKFGIRLPTRRYTLLMMAEMPPARDCSIWSETDPETGKERRVRRWTLTKEYQNDLDAAIRTILEQLAPVATSARVFPDWVDALATGAHHSGTARMAASSATGVCDGDGRVHDVPNLYLCDGSVIPASGIANTGLTICALALRLAAHLRDCPRGQARSVQDAGVQATI